MNLRRKMYVVILSIITYFVLSIIYSKVILKDNFTYVYSISKNVSRGERVLESDLVKVKISNGISNKYLNKYRNDLYYKDDYILGTIILNDMVISNDEYTRSKTNTEIISLKLNFADDAVSYQLEKGSIVNIFCSAKLLEIEKILNSIDKTNVISNNLENGYVTTKLMDNIKIINCYKKDGSVAKKGELIDTILIEVQKEESVKINNLKNYGKFSVSLIK